jgi:hypothetical protein
VPREQLVRRVPVPRPIKSLTLAPPLRILGIASSPRDLPSLDVDREKGQLSRALASLVSRGQVELRWAAEASWSHLQDELLSHTWHVVHFIGHGDFNPQLDTGVLALVGQDGNKHIVEAHQFVDLLREALPIPRLIVLNSCLGAMGSKTDLFAGRAASLVRAGAVAVAAMQFEISDGAAIEFARGFYTSLANGRGVDAAVSSGRRAIIGLSGTTLEWATPVLYLRGDQTQLFALADGQAELTATSARPPRPDVESSRSRRVGPNSGGLDDEMTPEINEGRPPFLDLLTLTPTEFESLIRALFERMGIRSWTTINARDEGIDAIGVIDDPIFGGNVVIALKRYSKVVPYESMAALVEMMTQKAAMKGILVTTSRVGRASRELAARSGRVQIIDGTELGRLLKDFLNMDTTMSLPGLSQG